MTSYLRQGFCLLLIGFLLCLSGCSSRENSPFSKPEVTLTEENVPFRIIGYAPEWDVQVEDIQFDKLTHINYAFLLPRSDGSFEALKNPEKLSAIVSQAHAQHVSVLISIGGWGYDEQFEALAADPASRAAFIQQAVRFADEYALDGIDVDWEYPDPGESSLNFLTLMRELRSALPPEKLLTAAVVSKGSLAEGIPAEVFPLVDFLNIMAYDASRTDHSPFSLAEEALDYWQGRGLPVEKTVLGVPFYARPDGVAYRALVQADPTSAQRDVSEYAGKKVFYNGISTMVRKTELALRRASGIMIWELAHDTSDSNSLLKAIYEAVHRKP